MELSILIDFHNLWMMLGKDPDKTRNAVGEIMRMGRRKGTILEARLFIPIYFHEQTMWRLINSLSLTFGLEVEACPVSSITTDEGRKMKDSVDNGVMMHIVKNVHKDIGAKLIIFVTGDGDFVKFSTQAQNRGKKTEFWSVDLTNTNNVIKREGNFQEIELSPDLQTNIFLIALNKVTKKTSLEENERIALELVVKVASMELQGCEIGEMIILISERLGISYAESECLLEMLTTVKVAEITLATKRVINIDYLHGLFQYLHSYVEAKS